VGVVYKLSPELINFILEYKKAHPQVSCRMLALIVQQEKGKTISKSSISTLLKKENLSSPAGRKSFKKVKIPATVPKPMPALTAPPMPVAVKKESLAEKAAPPLPEIETKETLPIKTNAFYLLVAADLALGLSNYLVEIFKTNSRLSIIDAFRKSIALFLPELKLFEKQPTLDNTQALDLLYQQLPFKLSEVYAYKITLEDNLEFFLDAELRSLWSTWHFSREFSQSINLAKMRFEKIRKENKPLILLSAPPYLDQMRLLIKYRDSLFKKVTAFTENNRVLFETEITAKGEFILGSQPHQYTGQIKVVKENTPQRLIFPLTNQAYQVIETEVLLEIGRENIALRMLKITNSGGKTLFNLYTSIPKDLFSANQVCQMYFSFWPNPLFSFSDFKQKNELFSYALERNFLFYPKTHFPDKQSLKDFWRSCLHNYCLKHFFPLGYEKLSYQQIKERFYDLEASIIEKENVRIIELRIPNNYSFLKDLEYSLRRINENCLFEPDGKRLWFSLLSG